MNITSTRKTYKVYMDWQRKKERKKNEENNAEKKEKIQHMGCAILWALAG